MSESTTLFCQNCGQKISAEAKFCPFCGFKQIPVKDIEHEPTTDNNQKQSPENTAKPVENSTSNTGGSVVKADTKYLDTSFDQQAFDQQSESSFAGAINNWFHKLFDFNGRTSFSDFWWAELFITIAEITFMIVLKTIASSPLMSPIYRTVYTRYLEASIWTQFTFFGGTLIIAAIVIAVLLCLNLTLIIRRLHDSNKPGHFSLLLLFCLIKFPGNLPFALILIILLLLPSKKMNTVYGPPTKTTS